MDERTQAPSRFYKKAEGGKLTCIVCERRCKLAEDRTGLCGTKVNDDGSLKTLTYGAISHAESRPMELKPFYHFYPGKRALTISTWGCNLTCPWCQNHHYARVPTKIDRSVFVTPKNVVEQACAQGDRGICVSFNEPTMLTEYCLDLFPLSRSFWLFNTFVTNGYQTTQCLKALKDSGLDALNIDLKGSDHVYKEHCGGAKVAPVLRNIKDAIKMDMHVEVTNLVITEVNDDEVSIDFVIKSHLKYAGPGTPLHFTRYFPAYNFQRPPTDLSILEGAVKRARKEGVEHVYIGNVLGHEAESTYCPKCGKKVIGRSGGRMVSYALDKQCKCIGCGEKIPVLGWEMPKWK